MMRRTSYCAVIGKLPDVRRFAEKIGFSIERKNAELQDALSVIANHEPKLRAAIWRGLYSKRAGEWVRKRGNR